MAKPELANLSDFTPRELAELLRSEELTINETLSIYLKLIELFKARYQQPGVTEDNFGLHVVGHYNYAYLVAPQMMVKILPHYMNKVGLDPATVTIAELRDARLDPETEEAKTINQFLEMHHYASLEWANDFILTNEDENTQAESSLEDILQQVLRAANEAGVPESNVYIDAESSQFFARLNPTYLDIALGEILTNCSKYGQIIATQVRLAAELNLEGKAEIVIEISNPSSQEVEEDLDIPLREIDGGSRAAGNMGDVGESFFEGLDGVLALCKRVENPEARWWALVNSDPPIMSRDLFDEGRMAAIILKGRLPADLNRLTPEEQALLFIIDINRYNSIAEQSKRGFGLAALKVGFDLQGINFTVDKLSEAVADDSDPRDLRSYSARGREVEPHTLHGIDSEPSDTEFGTYYTIRIPIAQPD